MKSTLEMRLQLPKDVRKSDGGNSRSVYRNKQLSVARDRFLTERRTRSRLPKITQFRRTHGWLLYYSVSQSGVGLFIPG